MSTLLLSHIPKTAGTSVSVLVGRYQPDAVFVYNGDPDLQMIERVRSQRPSVVMGHFSYGVHHLLGIKPRYATILRDPVSRVVSLYRHLVRQRSSALSPGMTLREFVESAVNEQTSNHMCRVIGGFSDVGQHCAEDWPVELAMRSLHHHFEVVGIAENLTAFVARLAEILGWRGVEVPFENVADCPGLDVDLGTIAAIRHHNQLDVALYERIKAIVEPSSMRRSLFVL